MDQLDAHILSQIVNGDIASVTFRKDKDAADLLIADIEVAGMVWTVNEDFAGWPAIIVRLEALDGFPADWRERAAELSGAEDWTAWEA